MLDTDLETRVRGHSRSSEPTRIDPTSMNSMNVTNQPWAYLVPFTRRFQSKIS